MGLDYDDVSKIGSGVDMDKLLREEEFMAAETQWPTLRLIPQDDTLSDTKRHGAVNVSLYIIQQTPFNIDQDCSVHVKNPFLFRQILKRPTCVSVSTSVCTFVRLW